MKRLLILPLLAALLLIGGNAWAMTSFNGYTGLLFVPTGDTLDRGDFSLAIQTIDFDLGDLSGASATLGVADRWELGVSFADESAGTFDGFSVNSKYRISEMGSPSIIAVGTILPVDGSASFYGVLSQRLTVPGATFGPITGHVGWGTGGTLDGIFAAADAVLSPNTLAMVEYDSNDLNVGVRFAFTNELRAKVGLFGMSNLGLQVAYIRAF